MRRLKFYQKIGWIAAVFMLFFHATGFAKEGVPVQKAIFGAGCFWGVEKLFWDVPGVVSTQVGYVGGKTERPTYEQICTGLTGHAEAVEITYDPSKVQYTDLLEVFWKSHNPTTLNQQGNDRGTQYRSAIFYQDPQQKKEAERTKKILEDSHVFKNPITTSIEEAGTFYSAESYHQKYLKKNPHGYCSLPPPAEKISKILREASKNS